MNTYTIRLIDLLEEKIVVLQKKLLDCDALLRDVEQDRKFHFDRADMLANLVGELESCLSMEEKGK